MKEKPDNRPISDIEKGLIYVVENFAVHDNDVYVSDHKDDIVCFCDIHKHEVLEYYTSSEEMRDYLAQGIAEGKPCYELLKQLSSPCRFCSDQLLMKDRYYVWHHVDKLTDREYIHKSKMVTHNGEQQRMSIIQEITDPKRKDKVLIQSLESMRLWAECTRLLSYNLPLEDTVALLLEEVGLYLRSGSAFVWIKHHPQDIVSLWSEEGSLTLPPYLQNPTQAALDECERLFHEKVHVFIDDVETAVLPQEMRDFWLSRGITSFLCYPLMVNKKFKGLFCLNNISVNATQVGMLDLICEAIIEAYQRHESQQRQYQMRYRDELTGALNIEGFRYAVEMSIKNNLDKQYALWSCDIKNFRYINDVFGFEVGNEFLKYWMDSVSVDVDEDEVFARNSVDSVVAIQRISSIEEIRERYVRRKAQLAEFPPFKERGYRPELVCGVYMIKPEEMPSLDIDKLLNLANIAQKNAKQKASEELLTIYDEETKSIQIKQEDIKQSLDFGLKNNEFFIMIQPQFACGSLELVGAEALVRWNHSRFGLISPGEFIPYFEQKGLVTKLDLFVVEEVCKVLSNASKQGWMKKPVPISINLSRVDIFLPNLCEILLDLLAKYNLSPSMLNLEITESAFISSPEQLIETIELFRSKGFAVELDDFGSGYSSLTILKDVKIDTIKLDMGFLAPGYNQKKSRVILDAIFDMATELELETIAEGVESQDQVESPRLYRRLQV